MGCGYWLVFLFLCGATVAGLVTFGTSFLRLGWHMTAAVFTSHHGGLRVAIIFFPSFLAPPVCRLNDFLTYRLQRTSYPVVAWLTADRFVVLALQRLRESSPDTGFDVPKLHVLR